MKWWPFSFFHRDIREQVASLEGRVAHEEEQADEKRQEIERMRSRLRYLELQAELLARQHLDRFSGGMPAPIPSVDRRHHPR